MYFCQQLTQASLSDKVLVQVKLKLKNKDDRNSNKQREQSILCKSQDK